MSKVPQVTVFFWIIKVLCTIRSALAAAWIVRPSRP